MKYQFRQIKSSQYHGDFNNVQDERNSVAEQNTVKLPTIQPYRHETISDLPHKILASIPISIQRLIVALLDRVQDIELEEEHLLNLKTIKSHGRIFGWLPILTLTSSLGILLTAFAYSFSIYMGVDEENFLWLGLLVIFVPPFIRLISPIASRIERIYLLCVVDLSIYLVKVILSPNQFSFFDEYLHWRTVDDIIRSGHLFSLNPLLPVSSLYPALEIITSSFSALSGLNTFTSALIVIGVTRILIILSLFMLFEQITKSSRVAAIATMLYMCSPNFFVFDSLFIYESLAMPLGAFMLFLLARMETVGRRGRWLLLAAWLTLGVLVTAHHVSEFFFVGLLILWAILHKFPHIVPMFKSHLAKTALLGILFSVAWVVFVATPVIGYLFAPIHQALIGFENVITGASSTRAPFIDYSGHPTPVWQRLVMLVSLIIVTIGVPFGLICIWHRYRHKSLALMLGLVSLLYPLSQVLRLINSGADLTYRAAPLLFIPVSFVLAILITQVWPTRLLKWKQSILITFVVSLVFLGGALLGNGPSWILMPGSYVVEDDARTINPESIQAAIWTLWKLGPNNRIATDRSNKILMGTYGDQRIVSYTVDQIDVSPVFYSTHFYQGEESLLQNAQVQYLVVDLRMSTGLPYVGIYFEEIEPEAYQITTPISKQALVKFNTVSQINREFDSGNIVIYDVGELTHASKKS